MKRKDNINPPKIFNTTVIASSKNDLDGISKNSKIFIINMLKEIFKRGHKQLNEMRKPIQDIKEELTETKILIKIQTKMLEMKNTVS